MKEARRLWRFGFMSPKKEIVGNNSGVISFKRGADTPAPSRIMKSTKDPYVKPLNCKHRLKMLKRCAKKKNCNSKALKQAKKLATTPAPIMNDFRVTEPDRAAHAVSTDTVLEKCSGLNELLLRPKPNVHIDPYFR